MQSSIFAEDLFLQFFDHMSTYNLQVQHQDFFPLTSFYDKISCGNQLTKNQANYVLKLLEKYKNHAALTGFDYKHHLSNLQWKNTFRVLDLEKRIYVEKNSTGVLEICCKFPYQLKKEFDEEIISLSADDHKTSYWDPEAKIRKLNIYDFNLITLYEFSIKHRFQIDDSFNSVLASVEEIWQSSEEIIPHSIVTINGVELKNASQETIEYKQKIYTCGVEDSMLVAKNMGFPLRKKPETLVEKIAASKENSFWLKNNFDFFKICKQISGRVCIVLDRTVDALAWLQKFVGDADKSGVNRSEIKVCFRESKNENKGVNDWIKTAGVGGKVEFGKYLIFVTKPAKWLFKEQNNIKMLVTNNIYPPSATLTRDWFASHPCVIYLSETKPTHQRGHTIVEL